MNNDLCVLEKAILGSPASCRCSPNAIDIRMEILGDVSDCRSFYRKKRRHAKCHHDFLNDHGFMGEHFNLQGDKSSDSAKGNLKIKKNALGTNAHIHCGVFWPIRLKACLSPDDENSTGRKIQPCEPGRQISISRPASFFASK
ncbi:MAG TPA: hypothetical protein VGN88_00080 [Phycisphaerae bacterium]|jgi:hypothetical protein